MRSMTQRIQYAKVGPSAQSALLGLESAVRGSGIDAKLKDLVYLRVSQINGCAFCLDMHDKELRALGETNERIALLIAFREVPQLFSARERAALEWAEAVTKLGPHGVSDEVYALASAELGEKELVDLTLAVIAINAWNRMNVAFRTAPASARPNVEK
jgi:AhpD family alkylhydroperoxidase